MSQPKTKRVYLGRRSFYDWYFDDDGMLWMRFNEAGPWVVETLTPNGIEYREVAAT